MGKPTEKMIAKLAEFGIPAAGWSFQLASEAIRKIADNNWRLPQELQHYASGASSRNRDPAEDSYYGRYQRRYRQGGNACRSARRVRNFERNSKKRKPLKNKNRRNKKPTSPAPPVYKTDVTVTADPTLPAPWEGPSQFDTSAYDHLTAE